MYYIYIVSFVSPNTLYLCETCIHLEIEKNKSDNLNYQNTSNKNILLIFPIWLKRILDLDLYFLL